MSNKIKTGPKVLGAIVVIGAVVFGGRWWLKNHGDAQMKSSVPKSNGQLADYDETKAQPDPTGGNTAVVLPGDAVAHMDAPRVKILMLAWNAQMGLALANGGPNTTEGSLMQKHGVNLTLERQDDYGKMQEALVACANEISQGKKSCATGANFVTIMGDGGPSFFAGVDAQLTKLGPDYAAEIVGAVGRSYGEDKFMAPPNVVADKKNARGLLVAGVLKDGDWNIAMYWARQNEICNNPDPKTYDPNCLNWVATDSFADADDKYIQGYCEDRDVVKDNHKTGSSQHVCVNGVVTWTPGDVAVAKKKGGLVSVLSTRENASQMPAVIIGIRKWDVQNKDMVKNLLEAAYEGGDQIKRDPAALMKGAEASAKIYKEENAKYWAKYYKGADEDDAQGNSISLGGSRVFNLADAKRYFGQADGTTDAFTATYTLFGDIAKAQYPNDLPTYPKVEEVLNLSYLTDVSADVESGKMAAGSKADAPDFQNATVGQKVGDRSWSITFETGKADFTKEAKAQLDELLKTLTVGGEVYVEVHGHTDNVGDAKSNQALSKARADAVKAWLQSQAPANFPDARVFAVGHGQDQPVADNKTADGRAKNRRVVIVTKSDH